MIERILNILLVSQVATWIWLIMPIIVLVLSLYILCHLPSANRIISSLLFAAASSFLLLFTSLAWAFRDGMSVYEHSDDVDRSSHGIQAGGHFMEVFVPILLIYGIIVGAGVAFLRCRLSWDIQWDSDIPEENGVSEEGNVQRERKIQRDREIEREKGWVFVRGRDYYRSSINDKKNSSKP